MNLQKLRTESYRGIIFATFNADAEPLEEFLGDVRVWIDRFLQQGGGYPIKVSEPIVSNTASCTDPGWRRLTRKQPTCSAS